VINGLQSYYTASGVKSHLPGGARAKCGIMMQVYEVQSFAFIPRSADS
jgi:hypothetical protein